MRPGYTQWSGIPQPSTNGRQNPWDTAHRFDLIGPLEIKEDGRFYRQGTTNEVPVPGACILQSIIFREGGPKTGVTLIIEDPDDGEVEWVKVGVLNINRPILSEVPSPIFPGSPAGIRKPAKVVLRCDDDPSGIAYFKVIRWAGIQTPDIPVQPVTRQQAAYSSNGSATELTDMTVKMDSIAPFSNFSMREGGPKGLLIVGSTALQFIHIPPTITAPDNASIPFGEYGSVPADPVPEDSADPAAVHVDATVLHKKSGEMVSSSHPVTVIQPGPIYLCDVQGAANAETKFAIIKARLDDRFARYKFNLKSGISTVGGDTAVGFAIQATMRGWVLQGYKDDPGGILQSQMEVNNPDFKHIAMTTDPGTYPLDEVVLLPWTDPANHCLMLLLTGGITHSTSVPGLPIPPNPCYGEVYENVFNSYMESIHVSNKEIEDLQETSKNWGTSGDPISPADKNLTRVHAWLLPHEPPAHVEFSWVWHTAAGQNEAALFVAELVPEA